MTINDISRGSLSGSSGAVVTIIGDAVMKRGDRRVGQQGQFIADLSSRALPYISVIGKTFYVMERLEEENPTALLETTASKLQHTYNLLASCVWPNASINIVRFDIIAHMEKINNLLQLIDADVSVCYKLASTLGKVDWERMNGVKTHGDPTADNLMFRTDGRPVLTDPIPATTAVPDFKCVDIGKMMQSAIGYEGVRYEREDTADLEAYRGLQRGLSQREALAARYWCAIHLLRAIPYMPTERTRRDITQLFIAATHRI